MIQKTVYFLTLLLLPFVAMAQEVDMADSLRSDGKIYVVIAVLSIVLAGIFLYLIRIDNKVTRLEKETKK